MPDSSILTLRTQNQMDNNRMLTVVAVGLLHSIEMGYMSVDEAQAYMFNPYSMYLLQEIGIDTALINLWHGSLFLEDLEEHFPKEILDKTIKDLKEVALQLLDQTPFEPHRGQKWLHKGE